MIRTIAIFLFNRLPENVRLHIVLRYISENGGTFRRAKQAHALLCEEQA